MQREGSRACNGLTTRYDAAAVIALLLLLWRKSNKPFIYLFVYLLWYFLVCYL